MTDLTILQSACASPQDWHKLQALLAGTDAQELSPILDEFCQDVDQSDYSLGDWILALLAIDQWLEDLAINQRPLKSMAGYIHCCTSTLTGTLPAPDLARFTKGMLDQHGFDAVGK
jgi:hypothetical protein